MTEISLVLPFALPPPDLAPDLLKALDTPALASLLTRASTHQDAVDPHTRALPHEAWLAARLGALSDGQPAFAAAIMPAFGLDPGTESWFIVTPAHIAITRSHLSIGDTRHLQLSEAHSRALFDAAKPYFDELGKTLLFGDAHTWFMRAGDWNGLHTSTPDNAISLNLTDWLPTGGMAVAYRKLQNEIQMLWFAHPANAERESVGLPAINAFWIWGCSSRPAAVPQNLKLAVTGATGWLAALHNAPAPFANTATEALAGGSADTTLLAADLIGPALSGDWASWLAHMQRFETTLFAPALAALKDGTLGRLHLVLSHRQSLSTFTTSPWAQRAFWRSPSLKPLLP